jgi:hypothetical protein
MACIKFVLFLPGGWFHKQNQLFMKNSINKLILSAMLMVFFLPLSFSQDKPTPEKKKIVVITKSVDENGEEKVTKTVREGDEISDEELDKMVQDVLDEGREIKVDVDVDKEGHKKIRIIEQGIELNEEVEIEDREEDEVIIEIEKEEGAKSGDVIIIEEETTEEMDENGKVIKKTVKKKKKIIKKDGDN